MKKAMIATLVTAALGVSGFAACRPSAPAGNEAERAWWVFHTNRRANDPAAQDGVRWCHGTDIGIASSTDGGLTWTYRGTARGLEFEPGRNTFWAPCLVERGRTLHMFASYVRGDEAFLFYFTHPFGPKEHIEPGKHRSALQVAKLEMEGGRLVCDRNRPFTMVLRPPGGFRQGARPESPSASRPPI